MKRITAFLHPEQHQSDTGYQAYQAMLALGNGGATGLGLGNGRQKLGFVPEHHTDFIFSVFAEERGYVGCVLVLLLYFGQMLLGLWISWNARDRFTAILAAGIVGVFFCHVCINLGGVLGLLPITGVTLPFMSYGGSSAVTMLIATGMLLSVSIRRHA